MIRAFDCRERASQIQFLAWRNCDFRFFHPLSEEAASNLPMIPPQLPIVSPDPRLFLPSLGTTTAPAFDCTNKGRRAVSVRRGTPAQELPSPKKKNKKGQTRRKGKQ